MGRGGGWIRARRNGINAVDDEGAVPILPVQDLLLKVTVAPFYAVVP